MSAKQSLLILDNIILTYNILYAQCSEYLVMTSSSEYSEYILYIVTAVSIYSDSSEYIVTVMSLVAVVSR